MTCIYYDDNNVMCLYDAGSCAVAVGDGGGVRGQPLPGGSSELCHRELARCHPARPQRQAKDL